MMQNWIAVCLLVGQGIFLIIARQIHKAFGVYVETLLETQHMNINIRKNMAIQENDRAALAVLHNRRYDDPPLPEEKIS